MSAQDFNDYLTHDGVLDVLEARKQNGTLGDTAIERYSKHVKTVFQVGNERTNDYQTELGYPIEFLLLKNPYDIRPGRSLPIRLVYNQRPLANQLVYVGHKTSGTHTHDGSTHSHEDGTDHHHDELQQFRTDDEGRLNIPISAEGIWYVRTIHLVGNTEAGLTHESHWATVTFAINEPHGHEHDHEHSHQEHDREDRSEHLRRQHPAPTHAAATRNLAGPHLCNSLLCQVAIKLLLPCCTSLDRCVHLLMKRTSQWLSLKRVAVWLAFSFPFPFNPRMDRRCVLQQQQQQQTHPAPSPDCKASSLPITPRWNG